MEYVSTGNNNCGLGFGVLGATSTGHRNVGVGAASGAGNTTGDDNIFIGYQAGFRQTTVSNQLFIDNQDRGSSANDLTNSLIPLYLPKQMSLVCQIMLTLHLLLYYLHSQQIFVY